MRVLNKLPTQRLAKVVFETQNDFFIKLGLGCGNNITIFIHWSSVDPEFRDHNKLVRKYHKTTYSKIWTISGTVQNADGGYGERT